MKSPESTLAAALVLGPDSHERWDLVVVLHKRGDAATFRAAATLVPSPDPAQRALGADVLAQLGAPADERPFSVQSVDRLLHQLIIEQDSAVIDSIASALGHLEDPRCAPALVAMRCHPDPAVRLTVVFGLTRKDDDAAVDALIELSNDADPVVRDWATFGLGTISSRDEPHIRQALLARLTDSDADTREEAIRGLASRHDLRAIPALLQELERTPSQNDVSRREEALLALASSTGDARLRAPLEVLHRQWLTEHPDKPLPDKLASAIGACRDTAK